MEAFERDFALLCENARKYNQEGSLVYEDSEILRLELYPRLERICRAFGLPIIQMPSIQSSTDIGLSHLYGSALLTAPTALAVPRVAGHSTAGGSQGSRSLIASPGIPKAALANPQQLAPASNPSQQQPKTSMSLSLPKALFSKK